MEIEQKIIIGLVVLSVLVGAFAYPMLPPASATHFGILGNGSKPIFEEFYFPLILAVLAALFFLIPVIDPLRANIDKFRKDYFRFCIAVLAFFFIVYAQTLLWNLGTQVSFSLTIPVLVGLLFIYMGAFFLKKTRQSWFIGIRTPWTLSSPEVWEKTHRLGATLFEIFGVMMILSVFFLPYGLFAAIAMLVVFLVALVVYSYFAYEDLKKGKSA